MKKKKGFIQSLTMKDKYEGVLVEVKGMESKVQRFRNWELERRSEGDCYVSEYHASFVVMFEYGFMSR